MNHQPSSHCLSILGAGAWGTALATVACRAGATPLLWDISEHTCHLLNSENGRLSLPPGVSLPKTVTATTCLKTALNHANTLLCVLPSQAFRSVLTQIQAILSPDQLSEKTLLIASKGLETDTGYLFQEIVHDMCPPLQTAFLSGPNLAHEVAANQPTAATLAASSMEHARHLAGFFQHPTFELSLCTDKTGVQVAGALKNIVAIACGFLHGKGASENTIATLLTQGLAEMVAFGKALGAEPTTFLDYAGVGDLVLTCKSLRSRNTSFGVALGKGLSVEQASQQMGGKLVEGCFTAFSVRHRAEILNIQMPVTQAVCSILEGKSPNVHNAILGYF